jgi:hypothetical protein
MAKHELIEVRLQLADVDSVMGSKEPVLKKIANDAVCKRRRPLRMSALSSPHHDENAYRWRRS